MWKHCILVAIATPLLNADALPVLPATSLTINMTGNQCQQYEVATGVGWDLTGFQGVECGPNIINVGFPVGPIEAGFPESPEMQPPGGMLILNGKTYSFEASPAVEGSGVQVRSIGPSPLAPYVPPGQDVIITVLGQATGTLLAGCFLTYPGCNQSNTQIAYLSFDLPGYFTIDFAAFEPKYVQDEDEIQGITFTSTPEPSTTSMLMGGLTFLTAMLFWKNRKKHRRSIVAKTCSPADSRSMGQRRM
jgi:hypothetical protein